MTGSQVGPGWYSDPTRVHELRYFDARWTDFVVNHGVQSVSPMPPTPVWTPSGPAPSVTFAGPVQRVGPGHAPNVPSTARRTKKVAWTFAAVPALLALALAIALLLWPHRASAPTLVSTYGQSYRNLTYKVSSTGMIDGLHKDSTSGAFVGTMTIKPPLYGTGPIKGVLSGRTFTYSSVSGGEYTARLGDDGVLTGTYSYGAGAFTGQRGTWRATPVGFRRTYTGLPTWLWFVVAGLAGAAAVASAWLWRSRR